MKRVTLLIIFCLFAGLLQAQDNSQKTYSFSLQQCIDYAMQNQHDVANARLSEQIAHRQVQEVTAVGLPQVNGTGTFNDYINIPTTLIPGEFFGGAPGSFIPVKFGTNYSVTGGISASQLIFDGTFFLGLQAAKAYEELTKKSTVRSQIETTVTVSKAYYSVLVNSKSLELINSNLERLQKLQSDTKAMYDNGFVEKNDLDRITVNYNNLMTQKTNAEKLLALGNALLKFQMGMDVKASLTLTDSLKNENFSADLQGAVNPENRIEYKLIQSQINLDRMNIKRYKVGYLPSLAAFGSYSWNAQRQSFNFLDGQMPWFNTFIVGLQLNVPIFDGLNKARNIQEKKLILMQNQNDLALLQNSINLEAFNATTSLENAIALLKTQKSNMDLAEQVFNTTKIKYEQGVGGNIAVIDAQTDLKQAQTDYLNSLFNALIAKIDYEKAIGQIK